MAQPRLMGRMGYGSGIGVMGIALTLLIGCGSEDASAPVEASSAPTLHTVNYPLYFMARALAGEGEGVRVVFPEIPGDPALWQPTADVIAAMQQADLIVLNGAGYEPWLSQVTLPEDRLLDTAQGFRDQWIDSGGPTHSHGAEGEHAHAGYAFTTWLDLAQARSQAQAIHDRLLTVLPGRGDALQANWAALAAQLDGWDQSLLQLGRRFGDTPVLFSHPVYQYFERRYGFNGRSLHWEPDRVPPQSEWDALRAVLAEHPARLMIWEAEPLAENVERLRDLGVESVVFAPSGNRPPSGDFAARMQGNIERLTRVAPD
jgi:zinc transport system substrate-binding protein